MGDSKKNNVNDSSFSAGGNIHIGDIYNGVEPFNCELFTSLINRHIQDEVIESNAKHRHVLPLLIHSHDIQCPDSYVERLALFRIGNLLKTNNTPKQYIRYQLPNTCFNEEDFKRKIHSNIEKECFDRKEPLRNIIDSVRLSQAGPTVFFTSISEKLPLEEQEKMIRRHSTFWSQQPDFGENKPVVAIINIIYPPPDNFFSKWIKRSVCFKLRDCVHSLADNVPHLVVLPELSNIEKEDTNKWFSDSNIQKCPQITGNRIPLRNAFDAAFKKSKNISLKDINNIVNDTIKNNSK